MLARPDRWAWGVRGMRWRPRKARAQARQIPSPSGIPDGFLPVAPTDSSPGALARLNLLRRFEAEVRHTYHQRVMATDPREGHVVAVIDKTDPVGAALFKEAGSPPGGHGQFDVLSGPRRTLAWLLFSSNLFACSDLERAPHGVLVVAIVAFGGATIWWLRGASAPEAEWQAALIPFERRAS